jgi:hypothetical protein
VVLFIVMVLIVMISLAGLSFVITMSTENKAVHVSGDVMQIEQVVASGEELLKAYCELSLDERRAAGGAIDNAALFRGALVVDDGSGDHRARFSVVAPQIEDARIVGIRFGAENESARLNLARLPQWDAEQPGAAQEALMNLPGMTEGIADAILDWIDVDPAPRPNGAEAEYYAGLGVPYRPRNGIPTSLDELLLIRDVSRHLLFGADADFNHQVDEVESQLASAGRGFGAAGDQVPWASLLTVYSAERNTSYEGSPRIHLNERDLPKLHKQLKETFDASWADFIVAYRQFGPWEGPPEETWPGSRSARRRGLAVGPPRAEDLRSAVSRRGERPGRSLDLSRPARFEIGSVLDLIGVKVRLRETVAEVEEGEPRPARRPPYLLESPFEDDRLAMEDYLPKLVDAATVTSDKILRGRINVNGAPRAVLLGVPGLDRSAVDQIIAARGLRSGRDDAKRRHVTWLLTEGIVDREQMRALEPYLTTGGDVFRAQVVGYFEDSGLSARAEVVVDGTASPPRQLYWKDLRLFGRGYSLETLGAETGRREPTDSAGPSPPLPLSRLD